MDVDLKEMEWSSVHPCLLCKTHFTPNLLRHLYSEETEDAEIRAEILAWNPQLQETDSKFVCIKCAQQMLIFLKMKKDFLDARRTDCVELKIEVKEESVDSNTRFIYVDDLPEQYDGTPFPTPHCPMVEAVTIKTEPGIAVKIEKPEEDMAMLIKPDPESIFKSEVVNEKRLKCGICNHVSYTQEAYRRHAQLHVVKDRTCQKCFKQFKNSTLAKFKNHLKLHSSFSCEKCAFYCTSKRSLDHHMKMDHITMECGACKEVFPLRQKNAHFSRHERCGVWICMTCWRDFGTDVERTQHMREEHGFDEEEEPEIFDGFVCAGCDYTTDTVEELRQHNLDNPTHVVRQPKIEAADGEDMPPIKLEKGVNDADMPVQKTEEEHLEELECATMYADEVGVKCEDLVKTEYDGMLPDFPQEDITDANLSAEQREIAGMRALAINETTEYEPPSYIDEPDVMDDSEPQFCAQCPKKLANGEDLLAHYLSEHSAKQSYPCKICGKKFDLLIALNLHQNKKHPALNGEDPTQHPALYVEDPSKL